MKIDKITIGEQGMLRLLKKQTIEIKTIDKTRKIRIKLIIKSNNLVIGCDEE